MQSQILFFKLYLITSLPPCPLGDKANKYSLDFSVAIFRKLRSACNTASCLPSQSNTSQNYR